MTKARPLCVQCGDWPKCADSNKWCRECWLPRQSVQVQARWARWRAGLVPEAARRSRVAPEQCPPGRRFCAGCQSFVRLEDASGSRCKACSSAAAHGSRVKAVYTIHGRPFTGDDYDELVRRQGGRCYVCGRASVSRRFAIDHDHRTGQVRGLLCPDPEWGCNLKVVPRFDALDDPPAAARRLVEYLSDPPAQRWLAR